MRSIVIATFLLSSFFALSQEKDLPVKSDFVNFDNIKDVLKKDGLAKAVKVKKVKSEAKIQKKQDKSKQLYSLPDEQDFWRIMTEYWLVKNMVVIKWDFHKPDFGMRDYFEDFLKQVGSLGVTFNILYTNSPNIPHFAFPFGKNEYLFVISVPFIKIMDLSKKEISILLYEDLLRVQAGYFQSHFSPALLTKLKDGDFYKKEFPKKAISKFMSEFDNLVYEKGFNFQQQYQVTKRMNNIFMNNKKLWQSYYTLIGKIDDLVKSNLMYKNYVKIYPSPELQRNWINPTKK